MAQTNQSGAVSGLLRAWGRGDLQARDELVPLIYRELRRRAGAYLRRERPDHTLQPTALVHEAFMRLLGQEQVAWEGRAHFFGIAAKLMRRVLVDHARERQAAKRQGAAVRVGLEEDIGSSLPADCELLSLDIAPSTSSPCVTQGKARLSSSVISAVCPSTRWRPRCRSPGHRHARVAVCPHVAYRRMTVGSAGETPAPAKPRS